jgi:hypothetical protein
MQSVCNQETDAVGEVIQPLFFVRFMPTKQGFGRFKITLPTASITHFTPSQERRLARAWIATLVAD